MSKTRISRSYPSIHVDIPTRLHPSIHAGWVSYCAIESFGSIGVSLFWAFVNATMDLEGAKKAYGLIIAGAQIGSILGPSLVISVCMDGWMDGWMDGCMSM